MISPQAIVDPNANIAVDVMIEPFAIIGPGVTIGAGSWVGPNAVIKGPTTIGNNNKIYQFCSIGVECQDKKYNNEPTTLEIGDNNTFRESCTVHRGTALDQKTTKIGNNNLFMVNSHVAHDCIVGDNVVFSNGASIAGHVKVQNNVNLSGFVGVNQFCKIGAYSFAAGGAMIIKDVMPFVIVAGHPAKVCGINVVGLERAKFDPRLIEAIKQAYKIVFVSSRTTLDAIKKLMPLISKHSLLETYVDFLQYSERGILR